MMKNLPGENKQIRRSRDFPAQRNSGIRRKPDFGPQKEKSWASPLRRQAGPGEAEACCGAI